MHLRPPGHPATVCGLPQKSVRTTRIVALATCQACLNRLRKLVADERLRRQVEELNRLGELQGMLTPVKVTE
jgi:hypothetical protein